MLSFSGSLKVLVAVEACDHAQRLQRAARVGDGAVGRGPAPGRVVRLQQPAAYADQDPVLGWHRVVGADQALEEGTFSWPKNLEPQTTKLSLTPQALAMLTDGVDLRGGKLRPWYERE